MRVSSDGATDWNTYIPAGRAFDVSVTSGSVTQTGSFNCVAGAWYAAAVRVIDQYGSSNDVIAGPVIAWIQAVPQTYCVSWEVYQGDLNAAFSMVDRSTLDTYQMLQDGNVIFTGTAAWGELKQFTKSGLATTHDVTLQRKYVNREYAWNPDLQIWVKDPVDIEWWVTVDVQTPTDQCQNGGSGGGGPKPVVTSNDNSKTRTTPLVTPTPPNAPNTTNNYYNNTTIGGGVSNTNTGGTVWSNDVDGNALDKQTYIEGVGKLERQLMEINGTLQGMDNATTDPNGAAITQAAANGAGATDGNGHGNGSQAAASSVSSAFSSGKDAPTFSLPSGSSGGFFSLAAVGSFMPAVNLDPAADPSVSSAADFLKSFIIWATSIFFAWFCWSEFSEVVRTLLSAQQAQGNAIVGGTGAQATALIAAAAITAILITVPLAYWSIATYSINPVSSVSGVVSAALYLLFFFFPVAHVLSLAAAAFLVKKGSLVLVATTATLIRFVVP